MAQLVAKSPILFNTVETIGRSLDTMRFFSPKCQRVIGPAIMLPQHDSMVSVSGCPLNSYAILRKNCSVLIDAPFAWLLDAVERLIGANFPPVAMILTGPQMALAGDAYHELAEHYSIAFYLHPDDWKTPKIQHLRVHFDSLGSPAGQYLLREKSIQIVPAPVGPDMLYLEDAGGILFTGENMIGDYFEALRNTPDMVGEILPPSSDSSGATSDVIPKDLPIRACLPAQGKYCVYPESTTR